MALFYGVIAAHAQEGSRYESKIHLGVSIQSKYLWRGMEMMTEDSSPVLFPGLNYNCKGFSAYVLGGYALNGKYSEVDLGLSYTYKWLTVGLNNYYYPTINSKEDKYFNFNGKETGHWFEGIITFSPEKIPAYLIVSSFFAGADRKPDGKRAYSTYAEFGGNFDFMNEHSFAFAVGAAFNKSCYNDYIHDFSICNIELKYTYNVAMKNYSLPLSVAYIVNPVFEKSHVNLTVSYSF